MPDVFSKLLLPSNPWRVQMIPLRPLSPQRARKALEELASAGLVASSAEGDPRPIILHDAIRTWVLENYIEKARLTSGWRAGR